MTEIFLNPWFMVAGSIAVRRWRRGLVQVMGAIVPNRVANQDADHILAGTKLPRQGQLFHAITQQRFFQTMKATAPKRPKQQFEILRAVQRWTFKPKMDNGKAVEERVKRRIEFKLGAG